MINKYIKLYILYQTIGAILFGFVHINRIIDEIYPIVKQHDVKTFYHPLAITNLECKSDKDCNNGVCAFYENIIFNEGDGKTHCVCNDGYIFIESEIDGEKCSYQQRSKFIAFLISFFAGQFGTDWFYLSMDTNHYIFVGICKCMTCGGFFVWWFVDLIRILTDTFPDGFGYALYNDM